MIQLFMTYVDRLRGHYDIGTQPAKSPGHKII